MSNTYRVYRMRPKKSFSQNFLRDESVLERIVREGNAASFDWIVEIGAGEGALTEALARSGARRILAFELDHDLIPKLLRRFPLSSNVSVIEADFLHTDIPSLLSQKGFQFQSSESDTSNESWPKSWSIFGNIPYGITGKIIRKLVRLVSAPDSIVLMVQREVAERLVEKDGKQSLLSLAVGLFGKTDVLFSVPKEAFFPVPEVESAIIRITPDPNRLPNETREEILRLARIGFASKRKTLANNFAAHREYSKETIEKLLETMGKHKNARAEELSAEEWILFQKRIMADKKP